MNVVVEHVPRLVPSWSIITNDTEIEYFWSKLLTMWRLPPRINHFPGSNPMSIDKKDFTRLQSEDFIAALKSDGVRHLLMLTTKPNSSSPIALMIDRTKKMYEVEIWAKDDFFCKGSLYDGELVVEKKELVFVVFDVIMVCGESTINYPYRERMEIVDRTILCVSDCHDNDAIERMIYEETKMVARNNLYGLTINPKRCVPKAYLASLLMDKDTSHHRSDGVIFTLNTASVETGTTQNILKWKPSHSVDLLFNIVGVKWKMYANTNNSSDMIDITDTFNGRGVVLDTTNTQLLDAVRNRLPCIIECVVTIDNERIVLTPDRQRSDKNAPNTMNTVDATISNVIEGIHVDEILQIVNAVPVEPMSHPESKSI